MPRLQADTAWWIANSGGQAKVTDSFSTGDGLEYLLAHWHSVSIPARVAALIPNQDQGVNPPTVQGAPLILEF